MAEKIKNNDFIEIDYTGKDRESGIVFDTTKEDVAKQNGLYNPKVTYRSIIVCVGEKQVIPGLDKELEGKEASKTYSVEISPEDGFGKKNAKLLRIIPAHVFKKQKLNPVPGLQVNVDGAIGLVKTAGGGRVIVDFNHPLSGKTLVYEVEIKRLVTDNKEKIQSFLDIIGMKGAEIEVSGDSAKIKLKMALPDEIRQKLSGKLQELVKMKKIEFKKEKKASSSPKKETKKAPEKASSPE